MQYLLQFATFSGRDPLPFGEPLNLNKERKNAVRVCANATRFSR